jgi:excisionase family DNA binding protein
MCWRRCIVKTKLNSEGDNIVETRKLVLDIKEAAQALCLSPWTIRRWIADGKLQTIRLGRRVLIEPSELKRIVEAGRKSGVPSCQQ